jgi:hypothetical protein
MHVVRKRFHGAFWKLPGAADNGMVQYASTQEERVAFKEACASARTTPAGCGLQRPMASG